MSNALNISGYSRYFEKEAFEALPAYSAEWFKRETSFDDSTWIVAGIAKKTQTINFDVPIIPSKRLTDFPELLEAIKVSVFLVRSVQGKEFSACTSGAQQNNHAASLINFARFLASKDIYNFSSVNRAVFDSWIKGSSEPLEDRLSIMERMRSVLEGRSTAEIQDVYGVERKGSRLDFSMSLLSLELGCSSRLLTSSAPILKYLDDFRMEHGFHVVTRKGRRANKAIVARAESSIRKELTAIGGFMTQTIVLSDLFPNNQCFTDNFLSAAGINPNKFAQKTGRRGTSTRNIPQPVFFEMMDRAIRWVTDYSAPLIATGELARAYMNSEEGSDRGGSAKNQRNYQGKKTSRWLATLNSDLAGLPGSPFPLSGVAATSGGSNIKSLSDEDLIAVAAMVENGSTMASVGAHFGVHKSTISRLLSDGYQPEGASLRQALYDFLPTACLMIIFCFTARREHEIEALTAGCCSMTENGPVIDMYSGKYLQGYERFPTTQLVVKAVHVLETLSESVRTESDPRILQFPTFGEKDKTQYWSTGKMNAFADFLDLPSDQGDAWVFSEHQFRRFFAMMYFYRWDGGDLSALSWHLRHTDFTTTAAYLTDADGSKAFQEVKSERLLSLVASSGDNTEICGGMVDEFKSLLESVEAIEPRRAEKMLAKKVDEIGYVMDFVGGGICLGKTPGYESRSACLANGVIQSSGASEAICSECPNHVAYKENVQQKAFVSALSASLSPMLAAAVTKAREIR